MAVLADADRSFFEAKGYVVVPGLVSQPLLDSVVDAVFEFLGQDPDDPTSWYTGPPRPHGMVQLFQHEALWEIRQLPGIHEAFSEVIGTERLWVSMDRANMKPPAHPDRPGWGDDGFLHWDVDPRERPSPRRVQGVVALADTSPQQGGFQCSTELYACLGQWLTDKAEEDDRRAGDGSGARKGPPDLSGFSVRSVGMSAGDLLIWDSRLPHGNGPNRDTRPRLAQYVTMFPAGSDGEREVRVRDFFDRHPPDGYGRPPGALEREPGDPPTLTALGRRLLGLDPWPA